MTESRDPAALSADARELAARMETDPTFCLDVAYQLLRGREQIAELKEELERERRRVEVCVRAMTPGAELDGSVRGVLRRAIPPLVFFAAGIVVFALVLLLLRAGPEIPV